MLALTTVHLYPPVEKQNRDFNFVVIVPLDVGRFLF